MKSSEFLSKNYDFHLQDDEIEALNGQFKLHNFGFGAEIKIDSLEKEHILFLVKGKARLLDVQNSRNPKTICIFQPTDVLDVLLLERTSSNLISSSYETEFISINKSLVSNNEKIDKALKLTYQNVEKIVGSLDVCPANTHSNTEISQQNMVKEQNNETISKSSALKFLDYLGLNNPLTEELLIDDLLEAVSSKNGINIEKKSLSWKELLNADYPLLLEDENKNLRWITDRAGNALIDNSYGQNSRYIPSKVDESNKIQTLLIKTSIEKKANLDTEPYSASWYLNIFSSNWLLSSQMLIAALLVQFFSLGMPFFYLVIFDKVFGHQNLSALYVIAIGMVLLSLFDLTVKSVRSYILSFQSELMDKACIELFLERLFHVPLSKINRDVVKAYSEGFNEIPKVNQSIASLVFINSLDSITSLIVLTLLFALNFYLALVCLVAVIAIALVIMKTAKSNKAKEMLFMTDWRSSQSRLVESLTGMETVKSLNAADFIKKKISHKVDDSSGKAFATRVNKYSEGNIIGWISNLSSLAILFFGAQFVLSGDISFGVYMAVNMMSRIVIGNFQKLSAAVISFQDALFSIQKLKILYKEKDEYDAIEDGIRVPSFKGKIEASNLTMKYSANTSNVLKGINFQINPGEKIVLVGKSGSGKSSLVKLLQRLYIQKGGYILIDDYNIADIDLNCLRSNIGVAVQKPTIFGGSIRENIALAKSSASMKEIIDVVNATKLDKFIMQFPKGLDTVIEPMGANLPSALISLISISRVFLQDPSVLILDGTLESMSLLQKKYFTDYIIQKYVGKTCILVTDSIYAHEKADKIIVLNEGEIVEQGSFRELMNQEGYYFNLFASHIQEKEIVES